MRYDIAYLRDLLIRTFEVRGIVGQSAILITEDLLEAELAGKKTHGLGKTLLIDAALENRRGGPIVSGTHGSYTTVDGNGELGQIAATFCMEIAADTARQNGVGVVGLSNASRFGRLAPYVERVAKEGMVGLLFTTGGPAAVVPSGSKDPILGANPVAFGFPSTDGAAVIDFATSQRVWGEIRQAILEHRGLPAGAFVDQEGRDTTDPEVVEGVHPFGGYKGSALVLAIELLVGAVCNVPMGLDVQDEYHCGSIFIAIDCLSPQIIDAFRASTTALFGSIERSRSQVEGSNVRTPGMVSKSLLRAARTSGYIEADEALVQRIEQMSRGIDAGLERSDKLN